MRLPSGTRLGPYEILAPIGAGGMGEVYEARDTRLDRTVAIKVLPPDVSADPERRSRFEREAKTIAGLNHSHICTLHDVGEHQGSLFLVMELLEGEPLRARLSQGPLPVPAIVDMGIQLADALESAHAKGIIHRDIKPENIFLTTRGMAKLLDFGIAKLAAGHAAETATMTATRAGVLGTVGYMSPEQAQGAPLDARSDLFSLGAVLFETATGGQAFPGDTAAMVFDGILNREPAWPPQPVVPGELQRIVSRLLEKDCEARYQSATEVLADLRRLKRDMDFGRPTPAVVPVRKKAARLARPAIAAAVGLAAVVLAAVVVYLYLGRGQVIDSLAVLPIVNAGADDTTEYLSDGITENLINSLSHLSGLRVMSRSVVLRYKGRDTDPQAVGRELKVQAVVAGRLVQRGDSLDISVELVDARDGARLWGDQYRRTLADVQAVQVDITRQITDKLRVKLTGEQQKSLGRRQTGNSEAYQDYLRGRYYWNRRTAAGMRSAVEYFNKAIARDPTFALAYAGLAQAYVTMSMNAAPARDAAPKARAAALRALEIDDTLGEAHAVLGKVKEVYDFDFAGAVGDFDKAIELHPGFATARQWNAESFFLRGHVDEALAEIKKAEELDPLSLMINAIHGWLLLQARRYDEAIAQLRQTVAMDRSFSYAHFVLGRAYLAKRMYPEALAEFQAGQEIGCVIGRGQVYAMTARRAEAEAILNEVLAQTKVRYVPAPLIANLHVALGDKDRAFEWLDKGVDERGENIVWLRTEPTFDPLRSDARFRDVLRRLKLAP